MRGAPKEHVLTVDGARLTWFEWGREGDPQVLLAHATGFHARCWDQTVAALAEGYHVIALDQRGHGRSDKIGPYVWKRFGADIEALAREIELHDAIGVGHSMGGHCVTQVAHAAPEAFCRLLLVDPVIVAPELYAARQQTWSGPGEHPVARRREQWADWREMYDRFADRLPFSRWQPAVLEDYCRYGLLPDPAGDGWRLACPGIVEASIYMGSSETDIHAMVPAIHVPVVVLRAKGRESGDTNVMDFSRSPTWPDLAAEFPNGRDVFLPDHSHFIPMEDPRLVARFIADADATL
jgi:pimeloyl-ACP methyl ester carboxylesterase